MRIRRLPLALLALLLTGALVAGCGSDDKSSGDSGSGGGDKQDASALLNKAFSPDNAVKSGELKLTASADLKGDSSVKGPLKLTLGGPFAARGKNEVPLLDLSLQASGMGQSIAGKLITTADNAFIGFRGQTYEVGSALYKQFLDKARQQSKGTSTPTSLSDLGLKPEEWLTDAKVSDGPSLGGDSTQEVSGTVDTEKVIRDFLDAAKSPAISKQLQAQGGKVPTASNADIEKVKSALVDPSLKVDVDSGNHLRRLAFTSGFKRPKGETTGPTGGTVSFTFEYPKVGGTPDIKAPSGAKPIQLLLQQFGGAFGAAASGGGLQSN